MTEGAACMTADKRRCGLHDRWCMKVQPAWPLMYEGAARMTANDKGVALMTTGKEWKVLLYEQLPLIRNLPYEQN